MFDDVSECQSFSVVVAQSEVRWTTIPEVPGSNPGKTTFSQKVLNNRNILMSCLCVVAINPI